MLKSKSSDTIPLLGRNKKTIPTGMKLALMIAVIAGIWGRSCWRENQLKNITFQNIRLENIIVGEANRFPLQAEVIFETVNNTSQYGKKNIIIEIYTSNNELIATRLTTIDLMTKSSFISLANIGKFDRPLKEGETISHAQIKLYHKSAF